jgi:uncharacterized protein (TIGR02996 family)
MHPDEGALLRSVIENPDDDVARLVIADWYEENGQPERAEFIRVQIELTRMTEFVPRRAHLMLREAKLLYGFGPQWTADLEDAWFPVIQDPIRLVGEKADKGYRFNRGFVDQLKLAGCSTFCRFAEKIYQTIPLQFLQFSPYPSSISTYHQLFSSSYFPRLKGFAFAGTSSPREEVEAVFSHPSLEPICFLLNLPSVQPIGAKEIRAITTSTTLNSLSRLEIACVLTDHEVDLLGSPQNRRELKELSLLSLPLSEPSVRTLITSPKFKGLEKLELGDRTFVHSVTPTQQQQLKLRLEKEFGDRLVWR